MERDFKGDARILNPHERLGKDEMSGTANGQKFGNALQNR
jgi:hypothetical protein